MFSNHTARCPQIHVSICVCACSGVQCTDMTYVCADGTCLKKPNPECDFVTDCPDASDEKQCGEKINTLSSYVFFFIISFALIQWLYFVSCSAGEVSQD